MIQLTVVPQSGGPPMTMNVKELHAINGKPWPPKDETNALTLQEVHDEVKILRLAVVGCHDLVEDTLEQLAGPSPDDPPETED